MYDTNHSYGNATILAAYADLEEPLFPPTIPGFLQPWLGEEVARAGVLPGVPSFIWGRAARMRRHRAGLTNHTLIGAPWLYLLDLEKRGLIPEPPLAPEQLGEGPEPGRLLYFPHHGIAGEHAASARARTLRGRSGVTVVLTHEQAATPETVEAYTQAGARVVDLGRAVAEVGSTEPFYLQRLLQLMRVHRTVQCDAPEAFALFAHTAGLPVECGLSASALTKRATEELGTDCVVPAQELRAIFDWSTHA